MVLAGSPVREQKKAVRKEVLARRAIITEQERLTKSQRIAAAVLALPEFQKARVAMLFLNFRDEVETTALAGETLRLGKRLILPRCAPNGVLIPAVVSDLQQDIAPGMWGIREPKEEGLVRAEPAEIDFVLVPGAAFDLTGNRLGYGAGYYDRFFELLGPAVPRVAVAFACQIISRVPVGLHDVRMTTIVTEENVYRI